MLVLRRYLNYDNLPLKNKLPQEMTYVDDFLENLRKRRPQSGRDTPYVSHKRCFLYTLTHSNILDLRRERHTLFSVSQKKHLQLRLRK